MTSSQSGSKEVDEEIQELTLEEAAGVQGGVCGMLTGIRNPPPGRFVSAPIC